MYDQLLRKAAELREAGRSDESEAAYRRLIVMRPDRPEPCFGLGLLLEKQGRAAQAAAMFDRTLRLAPGFAPAHNHLGLALLEMKKPVWAARSFRKALRADPSLADARANLAVAMAESGRKDEAVVEAAASVALQPDNPGFRRNLCNFLRGLGREMEAVPHLEALALLEPENAAPLTELASIYRAKRMMQETVAAAERAIARDQGRVVAYMEMGQALFNGGRWREAEEVYRRGLAATGEPGFKVRLALLLPIIADDDAEIENARHRMVERLGELSRSGPRLDDPLKQVGLTSFYPAYHGRDERSFQEDLSSFYLKACPELGWTAPHVVQPVEKGRRLRVGFVSRHLRHGHTMGKNFAGLMRHLPRDRFEAVLFRPDNRNDPLDRLADRKVSLPANLAAARSRVAEERLDAILYTDIGMEPFTYFLAFARLARMQMTTIGHPVTSGIPNMDFFVTCDDFDPPGSDVEFSERLIRLSRPPICFSPPPEAGGALPGRRELGLPEGVRLYICAQMPFKIQPVFDRVLAEILRRDPQGLLVLIDSVPGLGDLLRRRLAGEMGENFSRVIFLPGNIPSFPGLLAAADVLLDSFPFSGGTTSLEAFAIGAPIVTLPTRQARGRLTAAYYMQMGMDDLIAGNAEHYIELALRTANDLEWRETVCRRIRAESHVLFDRPEAATELGEFIEAEIRR